MIQRVELLELLQCLIDAQALLVCANDNAGTTEDIYAPRRREIIQLWREKLDVVNNFPVFPVRG